MNKALLLLDLLLIDQIFKKVGGRMFLLYGTALGAYRDGDFLPGDDDLDVGSFDVKLRDQIANEMRAVGFEVDTVWDENTHDYHESEMIHARHDVHVDIFFFRKTQGKYIANRSVKEEPFVELPFKGMETVHLLGNEFLIPSPTETYLEFCYDDWKDPTKKDHGKLYHDLQGKKFEHERF